MSPIIAIIGIGFALYYVTAFPPEGFHGYFDKPAAVLVGLMPPCVMLLSHTIKDFGTGIQTLFTSLFRTQTRVQQEVIEVLTKSSALVRSNGIGALVNVRGQVRYDLLRDGISLIVNDFSAEEIRHNLTNKINSKQSKMALASSLFENMGKLCPGVGMLGSLIGLIAMMANMKDPTKISGGLAMSMIATLYGLGVGTLLYSPCGEKIAIEAEKSLEIDLMVLEGVLSLKNKKSSVHLKDIMSTFAHGKGGGGGGSTKRG